MKIFDIPTNKVTKITTGVAKAYDTVSEKEIITGYGNTYVAIPTDQYEKIKGVKRRLFKKIVTTYDIWISND